jgi:hypothetical protein
MGFNSAFKGLRAVIQTLLFSFTQDVKYAIVFRRLCKFAKSTYRQVSFYARVTFLKNIA